MPESLGMLEELCGGDKRFDKLARNVGLVIEQHAYGRLDAGRRERLERFLVELLYATPGLEAVEQRLNAGVARPLRRMEPAEVVSSADCTATAHELRLLRPVQLAVVAALGDDGHLYLGTSSDRGTVVDEIAERVLDAIERTCKPDGVLVEDVTHEVAENGGLKS